jgi:hypothetical protein
MFTARVIQGEFDIWLKANDLRLLIRIGPNLEFRRLHPDGRRSRLAAMLRQGAGTAGE